MDIVGLYSGIRPFKNSRESTYFDMASSAGQFQNKTNNIKETFPSVSLSVKNPISSKVLIMMIIFQILSNVGILYFLYLGME